MWHQITILGNLGKDPEQRFTPSGQAVTSFSVATSRSYKKNEEWCKETVWFRCETWGKLAEVCGKSLSKGSKVLITGRIKPDVGTGGPRIWEKSDGTSGASFEVVVNEIKFLDKKKEGESQVDETDPF